MALALKETDDSTPPADGEFVEGDFLFLLACFDRLACFARSPAARTAGSQLPLQVALSVAAAFLMRASASRVPP